ncbi:hypothetical protein FNV43_RR25218 [Rhamnella rubrinervis]|uniref:ADP-ribosyl cyclase/cyclic ADP-ribose hydrolase n=1 Tax=Rhamnella rubrinervis TaxID=2594499 RepID=A0A8K0DUN5_9ROSA|nr:hypothetical protein FNV43_RR25218 [Rhamnella rubrinervis]
MSSSNNPTKKYDVFLSFRGEDTRNNFTGHLYAVLVLKGLYTYKDDVLLERGREISPELLQAIDDSQCAVVILSKDYASSPWCLTELVRIVECKGPMGRILPIFYHVDKSQVMEQSGSYEEALKRHEADPRYNQQVVKSWRDALTAVANIQPDWHVQEKKTDEAKFIKNFVLEISKKIGNPMVQASEGISGVHSRLNKLELCVNQSLGKVRFIGICGMGGIGKTTLAKAYYKRILDEFEDSCSFLEDVREVCKQENGLVELQNALLSDILKGSTKEIRVAQSGKSMIRNRLCHKKVLIILDDVDELEPLKALAGKEDWFGSGSIIIITTRDEGLLKKAYGNQMPIYRVELLNESEALELLFRKAFTSTHPLEDYSHVACSQVLAYANGLPFALEVLGSYLEGLHFNEWGSALSRLKEYPKMEILDVLQVSFDGLEEPEKDIFLDIACFFVGSDKDYVIEMLNSCRRHADFGVRVLIHKSLLIIDDDNKIWMHGLLQQMGKEIVRKQSPKEPGRRSRIWEINDISHILEERTGTDKVESIITDMEEGKILNIRAISKMKKLRLLILRFSSLNSPGAEKYGVIDYLSNELGFLEWNEFPFIGFPTNFQPNKLVTLKLIGSHIEQICWKKVPIQVAPWKLKNIDLSYSRDLNRLEDFRVVPNLEQLILEGCTSLSHIHTSITCLKQLLILNLKGCISLQYFPQSINGLESLRILNLYGCSRLSKLPEDVVELKSLEDVDLRRSGIKHVPAFVVPIKNLKASTIDEEMESLYRIVGEDFFSAGVSSRLTNLDLSGRNLSDETVPQCFHRLVSLEYLNLSRNSFTRLPLTLGELSKLQVLVLEYCEFLTHVGPQLPSSLEVINVNHCASLTSFFDPSGPTYFCCCVALCVECHRLVHREQSVWRAFTFLKRYLQYSPPPRRGLDIVLPSIHIPSWFTNISLGPSTSIEVHPNWCNSSFKGWAVCALFNASPSDKLYCDITFDSNHGKSKLSLCCPATTGRSRHIWVFYKPRHELPMQWLQENTHGRFQFSFHWGTLQGNSCGPFGVCVRLVYETDIKELNMITSKDQIKAKDANNKDYVDIMSLNKGWRRFYDDLSVEKCSLTCIFFHEAKSSESERRKTQIALAKSNESEGRKTRIRRSKEERKTMVESFIKKYQKLNNGNFPSLNVTHKEVGGSFYTVREIVRDIIQENRVLGPAKFGSEEQSLNQFLEQDPLGSIASGPQYPLTTLANECQFITNHLEGTDEPAVVSDANYMRPEHQMFANGQIINGTQLDVKLEEFDESKHQTLKQSEPVEAEQSADEEPDEEEVLVSDGHSTDSQHQMVDNGQIIHGSQVDVKTRESDELIVTETDLKLSETYLQANVPSKAENMLEELAPSRVKVNPTAADVIVETFPLRPVSRASDNLDRGLGEISKMTNALEKQESKMVDLAANVHSSLNDFVEEKEVVKNSSTVLEKTSGGINEEAMEDHGDLLLKSFNCSAPKEGGELKSQSYRDSTAKESHDDVITSETSGRNQENAEAKAVTINSEHADGTSSISRQSKTENELLIENEADVHSDSTQNESNPTLNRINLESWEVASRNTAKPEGNPFLTFVRSFLAAFVKFWSG